MAKKRVRKAVISAPGLICLDVRDGTDYGEDLIPFPRRLPMPETVISYKGRITAMVEFDVRVLKAGRENTETIRQEIERAILGVFEKRAGIVRS